MRFRQIFWPACLAFSHPSVHVLQYPCLSGFLETGIPLGITFSFLIASPLVNEVILAMLAGLFGLKVALVYLMAGLTVAIAAGFIIGECSWRNTCLTGC